MDRQGPRRRAVLLLLDALPPDSQRRDHGRGRRRFIQPGKQVPLPQGERVCPNCGKPAIIRGKAEYGGPEVQRRLLCFGKKGGCGAKFVRGDPAIEGQETGRIANPDIADQQNTILKMAQKRAMIAATLIGVNASEFFTQDMEDLVEPSVIDVTPRTVPTETPRTTQPQAEQQRPTQPPAQPSPPR